MSDKKQESLKSLQTALGVKIETKANVTDTQMIISREITRPFDSEKNVYMDFRASPAFVSEGKTMTEDNWGPWNTYAPTVKIDEDPRADSYVTRFRSGSGQLSYVSPYIDREVGLVTEYGKTTGYIKDSVYSYDSQQARHYTDEVPIKKKIKPSEAALEIRKGLEAMLDQEEAVAKKGGKKGLREQMIARGDELPEQLQNFLPSNMRDLRDLPGGYGDSPPSQNLPAKPAAPKDKGKGQ